MTPEDKKKLQDAFNDAVNRSPYAEDVVEGLATRKGEPVTRRKLVEVTLQSEQFYEQVDKVLGTGKVTLDQIIEKFEAGIIKPGRGPKP